MSKPEFRSLVYLSCNGYPARGSPKGIANTLLKALLRVLPGYLVTSSYFLPLSLNGRAAAWKAVAYIGLGVRVPLAAFLDALAQLVQHLFRKQAFPLIRGFQGSNPWCVDRF